MMVWLAAAAWGVPVCGDEVVAPCAASLQEALDGQASDPAAIEIGPGRYAMSLDVGARTVVVTRIGSYDDVYLEGDGVNAVFTVAGGSLTIAGNYDEYYSANFMIAPLRGRAIEARDADVDVRNATVIGGETQRRGGLIDAVDSSLRLARCALMGGAAIEQGGLVYATGAEVVVDTSALSGGWAGTDGGLVFADLLAIDGADWEPSSFRDGTAGRHGSAIAADALTAKSAVFSGNEGGDSEIYASSSFIGSGLEFETSSRIEGGWSQSLAEAATIELDDVRFHGGRVNALNGNVTVTRSSDCGEDFRIGRNTSAVDVQNNLFMGAISVVGGINFTTVRHNAFLGGLPAIYRSNNPLSDRIEENVYLDVDPRALVQAGVAVIGPYNLWWPKMPSLLNDGTQVQGDPGIPSGAAACPTWASATLVPAWWGAAHDAGSPDEQDPDGSRVDIGAYGGVDFDVPMDTGAWASGWADADSDGVPNGFDCAKTDPTRSAQAIEVPYDGVDQDCRGDDDFDGDGDGDRPVAWGGQDCDDADPRRSSLLEEIDGNGIDDDCDGWADSQRGLTPRVGCGVVVGATWAWLLLVPWVRGRRGGASRPRSARTTARDPAAAP